VFFGRCVLADIAFQRCISTLLEQLIGDTKYQLNVRRFLPF
jgi:hypothetical protein